MAALGLLKLRRLDAPEGGDGPRRHDGAEGEGETRGAAVEPAVPGSIMSFTSAEALEAETAPFDRSA